MEVKMNTENARNSFITELYRATLAAIFPNKYNQEIGQKKDNESNESFAFIIHPLDISYLKKNFLIAFFSKFFPSLPARIEKIAAMLPGYRYGQILNITSPANGKTIRGQIYTIAATPKMILSAKAEKMDQKLSRLTDMAYADGAKIVGLGAYTKAYGDHGVTVAQHSPIPLTTGNSLSAASTLWAAEHAVNKMDLVSQYLGRYKGKAMVIGATGSIGQVCAKLLAERWDELVLIAPRVKALEKIAADILALNPQCRITIGNDANELVGTTDLIITATTARRKIVDIERVKAGAVICDTSRPFDISKEDAQKRPDVMVIAAGEVILPGEKQRIQCDLGLEGKRVYACLAETALLTLDGNYTNFTLGKDLDPFKVKVIDRLARKHGLKLAPLMGHDDIIRESDFTLCRERAIAARTYTQRISLFH